MGVVYTLLYTLQLLTFLLVLSQIIKKHLKKAPSVKESKIFAMQALQSYTGDVIWSPRVGAMVSSYHTYTNPPNRDQSLAFNHGLLPCICGIK